MDVASFGTFYAVVVAAGRVLFAVAEVPADGFEAHGCAGGGGLGTVV